MNLIAEQNLGDRFARIAVVRGRGPYPTTISSSEFGVQQSQRG